MALVVEIVDASLESLHQCSFAVADGSAEHETELRHIGSNELGERNQILGCSLVNFWLYMSAFNLIAICRCENIQCFLGRKVEPKTRPRNRPPCD